MKVNANTKDKEEKHMAVSMAVVPLLKGKAAEAIFKDFQKSKLNSYSDAERAKTNAAIAEILKQRQNGTKSHSTVPRRIT